MTKERLLILEMLQAGKITPAEALQLINALGDTDASAPGEPAPEHSFSFDFPAEMNASLADFGVDFNPELPQVPKIDFQPGHIPPVTPPVPPVPGVRPTFPVHLPQPPRMPHLAHAPQHSRRRRYPDPSYAVAMRRGGVDFSAEQLIHLQEAGVEPEDVDALLAVRRQEWSTADLVELLTHEVTPALVLQLHELGLGSLTAQQVAEFAIHDIRPDYIQQVQALGFPNLTVRELLEFGIHEVDLDAVRALREIAPVTAREAIEAGIHEVSASYVETLHAIMPAISPKEIIQMRLHNVTPRMIDELAAAGFTDVSPGELLQVAIHDADLENLAWFRETLGEELGLRDLIEFAIHDVSRLFVEEMLALEIPGLTRQTLVKMRIHGVEPSDVQRAREAYGDEITAEDLIDMAIHRWK